MKNYILFLLLGGILTLNGCIDPLDKEPLNSISEDIVFEDQALAGAYLLDLYDQVLWWQERGPVWTNDGAILGCIGAECNVKGPWQVSYGAAVRIYDESGAGSLDYWPFRTLRNLNYFIEQMEVSDFEPEFISQSIAEARFIRAFMYFDMAKRFGGVPIITQVLDSDSPEDVLFPGRNTEKEVYDFIISEFNALASILPDNYASEHLGRPTKFAALGFVSRAALYAASIANFGQVQINGLVGIPGGDANGYYQQSLQASEAIINSNAFSLYNKNADPAQNFQNLFVDENDNPEVIFSERFDIGLNKMHYWDAVATSQGFNANGWNSNFHSYLQFMELFDFVDGRSGKIDWSFYSPDNWFTLDEFIFSRDPRFRATFNTIGSTWQGKPGYYHEATWYTDESGTRKRITSGFVPGTDWPASAPARNRNRSSVHIRKRLDESNLVPDDGSGSDVIIIRYGEILLNYAEAKFYLGDTNEALAKLNNIRSRAGMPLRTEVTEDNIRHERQVELAMEEHRFWDLRRWRIAVEVLDGLLLKGFRFEYDYDTGMYNSRLVNPEGKPRVFQERNYYFALGIDRIADNKFVENPGY